MIEKLNTLSQEYCQSQINLYRENQQYKDKRIKVDVDCDNEDIPLWCYQMLLDNGAIAVFDNNNNKKSVRSVSNSFYVRVYKDDGTTTEIYNCSEYDAETVAENIRAKAKNSDRVEVKSWPMKYLTFKKYL